MRRKLLQPFGRYAIWKGRKGIPEYYIYDWDGQKIDVTWDYIEAHASDEIKEFYRIEIDIENHLIHNHALHWIAGYGPASSELQR